jgi:two-component system, sensor histidine kinase and response regulator
MTMDSLLPAEAPRILIVDDTPANLELLSILLSERGYELFPVSSGPEVLPSALANLPDLILLDINMPGMDGFEVCERLKSEARTAEIPVIFITVFSETEDKVKGFALGAVDYITKPFQIEEVRSRVATHIKICSLQRQLRIQNDTLERQVAERTAELSRANELLLKLGKLSDDFLRMISYEIRTPANGILGIGELIIELCPRSEESSSLVEMFRESSSRLTHLVDDAALIADIEKAPLKGGGGVSFLEQLAEMRAAFADLQIVVDTQSGLEGVLLQGDATLLRRALQTFVQLAVSFSQGKHLIHLNGAVEAGFLRLRCNFDDLKISEAAASSFFELKSPVRAESPAETLGLAPVAAAKIISAFGGEMRLGKGVGKSGFLEAVLAI